MVKKILSILLLAASLNATHHNVNKKFEHNFFDKGATCKDCGIIVLKKEELRHHICNKCIRCKAYHPGRCTKK